MMRDNSNNLHDLIRQHLGWFPVTELQDIYKLLYQGVMGSEHLIGSAKRFKANLEVELDDLAGNSAEILLVPVRYDGSLLRLNLRPLKNLQFDIGQLAAALLGTAESSTGSQSLLQATWVRFAELCETGRISQYPLRSVHGFAAWLVEMAFPAVHHSDAYRQVYQPAYRLISADYARALGLTNAG